MSGGQEGLACERAGPEEQFKITHVGGGGKNFNENVNKVTQQKQNPGGEIKRRGSPGFRKRKRSIHNVAAGGHIHMHGDTSYIPPYKYRRFHFRRQVSNQGKSQSAAGDGKGNPVGNRPRKFLLGGNERDPLNLNSLGGSDNAVTPQASPMPGQTLHRAGEIPILIPRNPVDPLGLNKDDIEKYTDVILGVKTGNTNGHGHKRKRHRRKSLRKRTDSECSVDCQSLPESGGDGGNDSENPESDRNHKHRTVEREPAEKANLPSTSAVAAVNVDKEEIKTQVPVTPKIVIEKEVKVEQNSTPTFTEEKSITAEVATESKEPTPVYPFRVSSEYIPLSSHYQPSPFVLDTMNENFTVLPFESPSMTNYSCSAEGFTSLEPFSPPPPGALRAQIRVPSGHYRNVGWSPNPNTHVERRSAPAPLPLSQQVHGMNHRRRHNHNHNNRYRLDPIVSPVIPQSGVRRAKHVHHHHKKNPSASAVQVTTSNGDAPGTSQAKAAAGSGTGSDEGKAKNNYRPKDKLFQYGNYNQYYGYRNTGNADEKGDARIRVFKKEWFQGKEILDIGCNIGHVTLTLARDFDPRRVTGIDIDHYLVKIAQKNIKHYVDRDPNNENIKFPNSLAIVHGALQPLSHSESVILKPDPVVVEGDQKRIPFPFNVTFRQENYVLDSEELLQFVKPQYDVILCLSITKWIHLNFGDDGLKRFFIRAYMNLRPGGLLILEPQPWSSYLRKKKLTEQIFQTFESIQFKPDQFKEYLLKVIGYASVELLGVPAHNSKGFQRPLYLFRKGAEVLSSSAPATPSLPEIPVPENAQVLSPKPPPEVELKSETKAEIVTNT